MGAPKGEINAVGGRLGAFLAGGTASGRGATADIRRARDMFTRVCKEDTVFEGEMRLVIADSHVIILAWAFGGEIKGFQGVCPHTNAPLETADFDGEVLTCPLHNWTWDLRTGDPIHPQESRLAEYPVKIEDGVVYIDTDGVTPLLAER
jgi:toluene monooxygenase system ferredoxin subunit